MLHFIPGCPELRTNIRDTPDINIELGAPRLDKMIQDTLAQGQYGFSWIEIKDILDGKGYPKFRDGIDVGHQMI